MIASSRDDGWIAVIVVNYGTADLAIAAVRSVMELSHNGREVRVFVVDNASPNEDAEVLATAFKAVEWQGRVTLFAESENHGFGRGNNVALAALRDLERPPSKVMLLNPDATLLNEAVDILASVIDAHPSVAVAGAAVLREDLSRAIAAFRFPNWRSELARILSFGPVDKFWAKYLVAMPQDTSAGPVDWVSGAAVMFDFSALSRVGFFDPVFFLYYEEVDLMRRLTADGATVFYEPRAKVVHAEGAATGQFASARTRQRDPWYLYQSWAHYFARAYGRPKALMIALSLWPMALLHILHRRLRGKHPTLPKRFFRDHWVHVVRPLLIGRHPNA